MVTPALTAKVEQMAKKLGYQRNRMAYALKTGRTFMAGILVPDIMNPVFPPIIRGLQEALSDSGYTIIEANSDNDPAQERIAVQTMKDHLVEGLVFATARRHDPLIAKCVEEGIPLVLINRTVDDLQVNVVINDDAAGTRSAVRHVIELGHRSIAYIAGPQNLSTGYRRYQSFMATMQDLGVPPDPDLVAFTDSFTEASGYQALMRLLQQGKPFTAVAAGNDLLALGCLSLMEDQGLRCPDDLSVIGFDDMPFMGRLATPLSTIAIQQYEMGVQAGHLFLQQLGNPEMAKRTISLSPTLIERASTGAPKRHK